MERGIEGGMEEQGEERTGVEEKRKVRMYSINCLLWLKMDYSQPANPVLGGTF